jgi:1,4-alpha-glucan branching enzyme
MKGNHMPKFDNNAGGPLESGRARREVAFILNTPEAKEVYLCGDFNKWSPRGLPMARRTEDHCWEKRLMLPPGRYEYKFIVNGIWIHNPDAPVNVPNRHGSLNSVVEVRL